MKKLINLFKRNKKTVPQLDIPKGDPKQTMYINNIIYYIEKKDQISIQSDPTDVKPYGWTIEFRWKHRDTWTNWQQYWTKKTYDTKSSATMASIEIKKHWTERECEWRISALYKMDSMQYRDYTIDILLSTDQKPKVENPKSLQFFKLKEDTEIEFKYGVNSANVGHRKYKKNQLFVKLENGFTIMTGSPTEPTLYHWSKDLYNNLIPKGLVTEIDIMKEKWYHPHLPIQLKNKLNVR